MSAKDYLMTLVPENEFLKALPPSDAELLSQAAEYVNFSQGQVLFQKGDVADSMFFIVEGAVEIIDDADNDYAILATLAKKRTSASKAYSTSMKVNAPRARAPLRRLAWSEFPANLFEACCGTRLNSLKNLRKQDLSNRISTAMSANYNCSCVSSGQGRHSQ